ncbi:hypothetical protein V502_04682 [Pseudogymnoascus sp. VKM F-4520 (FW-2644)]|nr:hypothetical protein V502_04682 [Pseudogymnoascus sp. VKM F-4520 (FW-2644)]
MLEVVTYGTVGVKRKPKVSRESREPGQEAGRYRIQGIALNSKAYSYFLPNFLPNFQPLNPQPSTPHRLAPQRKALLSSFDKIFLSLSDPHHASQEGRYGYPTQESRRPDGWLPSGLDKCGDCLQGNHPCVPAKDQFGVQLDTLQRAADAVLDSRADDEDAELEADSVATLQALAVLRVAQRSFSNAVQGKEESAAKAKGATKAATKVSKGKAPAGPSKDKGPADVVMRDVDDPRQALLHHAETLVELGKAKTEGLKAATPGASHPVMPAPFVMPSPCDQERALLERLFVKPSKWKLNTPPPAPLRSPSVQSLSSGNEGASVSSSSSSESESSSSSEGQGSDQSFP